MTKKIVLTGGGSAGHVTPNLALVPDLQANGYDVHYIGTSEGIEKTLITDIPFHAIKAGKLRRYLSAKNISDFFRILKGYFQAKKILKSLSPALVFSKGGFVSVPVVYAAAKLKIPVVLHESDYTPGLANRLCMKKAKVLCMSFDNEHAKAHGAIITGSPIRRELLLGDKRSGLEKLEFKGDKPVLLIMGGSLGAKAINTVVDENINALTQKFSVVHLRGAGNTNPALEGLAGYRQFEYVNEDLADFYAAADIALSRAGANAVFELLTVKIPALFVPLPLSASRGDQILNARYFEEKGFAKMLDQEKLTGKTLLETLGVLASEKETYISRMEESREADGTNNVLAVIYRNTGK